MTAGGVRAEALTKTYGRAATSPALADATLRVEPGEVVVVRGPSGSGKTTLLTLLAGLDRPDAGQAWIGDVEVSAAGDAELARLRTDGLGYVPQEFALVAMLTAQENVELPLRWRGVPAAEREERAAAALAEVGLTAFARQNADRLSGGQQQRVAVARALVARPRVLLADEPTAQLDTATGRDVLARLAALAHDGGAAVLIATHDREVIERADRVLVLADGRLALTRRGVRR